MNKPLSNRRPPPANKRNNPHSRFIGTKYEHRYK